MKKIEVFVQEADKSVWAATTLKSKSEYKLNEGAKFITEARFMSIVSGT